MAMRLGVCSVVHSNSAVGEQALPDGTHNQFCNRTAKGANALTANGEVAKL
jgi:hypothetical protein